MLNIQDYIESGILEHYALGGLDPGERAEVETYAAQHAEIREELERITLALDGYASAHAVTPPADMKARVLGGALAQIAQQRTNTSSSLRADVDAVAQTLNGHSANHSLTMESAAVPATATRSMWAMAASVALLLSLAGNVLLYNNWQEANQNLVAVQSEQARIAAATQVVERNLGEVRQQNAILRDDSYRAVALAGTKQFPQAHARVLFNPTSRKVFLDVKQLPALAEGKQYQLWALDKGKPVDAGMLAAATAAGDSLQQMKDISSAQAFAMTVEPAGGSVNPTMSTMTVIGNI